MYLSTQFSISTANNRACHPLAKLGVVALCMGKNSVLQFSRIQCIIIRRIQDFYNACHVDSVRLSDLCNIFFHPCLPLLISKTLPHSKNLRCQSTLLFQDEVFHLYCIRNFLCTAMMHLISKYHATQ